MTKPNIFRASLLVLLIAAASAVLASRAQVRAPPQLEAGQSLGHALGLKAATNLRDLGGYKTADGRTVARGLLYRSDVFHPMSREDIAKLGRIGLKRDYDLRTAPEIKAQPDQIPAGIEYVHLDVLADAQSAAPAQLEALMRDPKRANAVLGGGKIEAQFAEGYREFVSLSSAKRAFRELFLSVADKSKLPAVFHCTTGKDRTGWAAAALLTLLGVPKETVMADYMRTNEYLLPYYKKTIDGFVAEGGERAIPVAILGVKPGYLEAAFDEMQKRYGSIERYFAEGLGIDTAGQAALRDLYLMP